MHTKAKDQENLHSVMIKINVEDAQKRLGETPKAKVQPRKAP